MHVTITKAVITDIKKRMKMMLGMQGYDLKIEFPDGQVILKSYCHEMLVLSFLDGLQLCAPGQVTVDWPTRPERTPDTLDQPVVARDNS